MKGYFYILLFALALVGCSGHFDEPAPIVPVDPAPAPPVAADDMPLTFMPQANVASRASEPLQNVHQLFKAWAYKLNSSSKTETVMPGYNVKYLDLYSWQYDGNTYTSETALTGQFLKYWDASAKKYDFFGFAPATLPSGISVSISPEKGFSISGIPTHSPSVPDFVAAHERRYINDQIGLKDIDAMINKDEDNQPTEYHSTVPLHFHHILSKVEYRIYNTGAKTAVIDNIVVRFGDGLTYTTAGDFKNGEWTDFTSYSNNLFAATYVEPQLLEVEPLDPADYSKYKELSTPLGYFYEIPQSLHNEVHISLDIEGAVISRSFEMPNNAWEYDKNYAYYIHIDVGAGDNQPILIDLLLDDFLRGDPIDETQTNW